MPLLDTWRAASAMWTKVDPTVLRVTVGIIVYLAMLGPAAIASYALWAGPQQVGVSESWPLAFYFVVPYFSTVLGATGIIAVVRPEVVRRVLLK